MMVRVAITCTGEKEDIIDKCESTFWLYFNDSKSKLLSKYNAPKLNACNAPVESIVPLDKPQISFGLFGHAHAFYALEVSNCKEKEYCM